jgi:hypothetical protein
MVGFGTLSGREARIALRSIRATLGAFRPDVQPWSGTGAILSQAERISSPVTLKDRRSNALVEYSAVLLQAFRTTRRERPFTIHAIGVVPDHLHVLISCRRVTRVIPRVVNIGKPRPITFSISGTISKTDRQDCGETARTRYESLMAWSFESTTEKLPKGESYIVSRSRLAVALTTAGLEVATTLRRGRRRIIFDASFYPSGHNFPYERLFIRVGRVPSAEAECIRGIVDREALPRLTDWLKHILRHDVRSPLRREEQRIVLLPTRHKE